MWCREKFLPALGIERFELYLLDNFLTEEILMQKNRQYLCLILLFCCLYKLGKILNTSDKGNSYTDCSSSWHFLFWWKTCCGRSIVFVFDFVIWHILWCIWDTDRSMESSFLSAWSKAPHFLYDDFPVCWALLYSLELNRLTFFVWQQRIKHMW
jgi:hypothetical protein